MFSPIDQAISSCLYFPSGIAYSVGFHPSGLAAFKPLEQSISILTPHLVKANCVGVGEVGLDFTKSTPRSLQVAALHLLLPLARDHGKVLILHCRDSPHSGHQAADLLLSILQDLALTDLPIHFHCFSYPKSVAEQWIQCCPKVHFGLAAPVMSNRHLAEVAAWLPRDRLLLETDAPFLAPRGVPFHRNTPWSLCVTARYVARLRNVPLPALVGQANANACSLYDFPL